MPLNETQRRDFKTIPGADYSPGIISQDGGLFNTIGRKMGEKNKQYADSLPGGFDEDGNFRGTLEDIENMSEEEALKALDFINPMRGMMKTLGKVMSESTRDAMTKALNDGASTGSYEGLSKLPLKQRQEIVDELFSSRSLNEPHPLGIMGNQSAADVDYFGLTTQMSPMDFLGSAAKRTVDGIPRMSDKVLRKEFAFNIAKDLAGSGKMRIAPPYLFADLTEDGLKVSGHEGRHRSDAIFELFGNDVKIPVDMKFTKNGGEARRRVLDDSLLDAAITDENGRQTLRTLREMLPEGFDTSKLPMSNDKKKILMGWGEGGGYTWQDTAHEAELIEVLEKQAKEAVGKITRHGNVKLDFGDFKIGDTIETKRLLSAEKPGGNYQGRHDGEGRTIINTDKGGVYDFEKYGLPDAAMEKEVILPKNSKLTVTNFTPKGTKKTREVIPGFKEDYITKEDLLELELQETMENTKDMFEFIKGNI